MTGRKRQADKIKAQAKARRKPKSKDDFVSVARRLECDEDKGRFEATLEKIATAGSNKRK